jgi:tetratricopeptide (TPR) repeat protein
VREKILWYALLVIAIVCVPPYIIDRLHPGLILPIREKPVTAASVVADLQPGLSDDEKFKKLFQAGQDLAKAGNRNSAIANFVAAEQFALQLTDNKDQSLRDVRQWLASQYEVTQEYPEMEAVYSRMLDSLRETAPDYDINFGNDYSWLSMIRAREGNWPGAEESSRQAIDSFDKTIHHFDGMVDPQNNVQSAHFSKAFALYRLANAYNQEGKMDFAVYTADQAYRYGAEVKAGNGVLKLFATLGLQIATKANDRDAMALWGQRLDKLAAVGAATPPGF